MFLRRSAAWYVQRSLACAVAAAACSTVAVLPAHAAPASPAASAAPAVKATCGAVLTQSAYLAGDLTCATGLTLRGERITLDLRGHRLTGKGAGTGVLALTESSVTIKNGKIDHWQTGIINGIKNPNEFPDPDHIAKTGNVLVSAVTVAANTTGISGTNESGLPGAPVGGSIQVRNSRVVNNANAGVDGFFSGPISVAGSLISGNQAGVSVDTGAAVSITASRIKSNGVGVFIVETVATIKSSQLTNNGIGARGGAPIAVVNIYGSYLAGNESGFEAAYGTVKGNTFYRNDTGISSWSGALSVQKNLFIKNGAGIGGELDGNTVTQNIFAKNGDGIYATGGSIGQNLATHNTRYGIYAPGAIDLGGNQASHNGLPCVGVVCSAP